MAAEELVRWSRGTCLATDDGLARTSQKLSHEGPQIVHVERLVQDVYGTDLPRLLMHFVVTECRNEDKPAGPCGCRPALPGR